MFKFSLKDRKIKIGGAIAVVLIVLLVVFFGLNANYEKQFERSKQKINAKINELNALTNRSDFQFKSIDEKQKSGDIESAWKLVMEEKERRQKINQTAMELTDELKQLARISLKLSLEKRKSSQEAVSREIEAVGHLLNYGSGVEIILEELSQKYEANLEGRYFEIKRDIGRLISLIREEIKTAEDLSNQFSRYLP